MQNNTKQVLSYRWPSDSASKQQMSR